MTDTPNPDTTPVEPAKFDIVRLIADLRRGDTQAIRQAYDMTFKGDLGRTVLAHFMATCGVGSPSGPDLGGERRAYFDGRRDAALELMTTAGFDQYSATAAVITDTLEGQIHDRRSPNPNAGPIPDASPDWDFE